MIEECKMDVIPIKNNDYLNMDTLGSDLFRSYDEASCVALVVAYILSFGNNRDFTAIC